MATAGQAEIDIRFDSLVKTADNMMTYKYIVKNVARRHGKTATFMPKPAVLAVQGEVRVRCDRCGRPVEVPVDEQARFFFVKDGQELGGLPIDESPEEPLLGSHRFGLAALVEEQAILALPISPRHDRCSAAPPVTAEHGAETHRPFEALAELKKPRR